MSKYKVKGTDIHYNGKLYTEGKIINLEDAEASQLADYLESIQDKTAKKQDDGKQAENPANDQGGESK